MYVIDRERCVNCGLCLSWCPSQAIIGENPSRLKHALVYDTVYIDPEKCIECGLCLSDERPCPAYAIYDDKVGLPALEPADGTKYAKYIYRYDPEADNYYGRFFGEEFTRPDSPVRQMFEQLPWKWITRLDGDVMPNSNFYVAHWVLPHDEPLMEVGHPPHIHRDPEIIMVIGSDPENPEELGAEIEMCMGPEMEKHIINKTCVLFIPPYFLHCPWRPLRTTKPWIFIEINQGLRHTEKVYNQLLPRDMVERDEALEFFRDEGFDD